MSELLFRSREAVVVWGFRKNRFQMKVVFFVLKQKDL